MAKELGILNSWDLSDLYKSIKDVNIENDIARIFKLAEDFAKKYKTKVEKLDATALMAAITTYEVIQEAGHKLMTFAFLSYSTNVDDPTHQGFYQMIEERLSPIWVQMAFFTLEINRLSDEKNKAMMQDPILEKYKPWLRDLRAFKDYQLSDKEEELLIEKDITSRSAWIKFYDQTLSRIRFDFEDKKLTLSEMLEVYTSSDPKKRKSAAQSLSKTLNEHLPTFAFIINIIAKDKEIDDKKRGFKKPIASRNLANLIEDEVVDVLIETVKQNYSRLSERYYKLKAKELGLKKLQYWDRNAPLDEVDKVYKFEDAKKIVLEAYSAFSKEMTDIAQMFFDKNWIDAPPKPGKMSGAFSHGSVPSSHPYVMLNYHGKVRDVMTLAHELGHGVHQYLARKQGVLMADTPLTVAETASVFGEQLTFRKLLENETNAKNRKILIGAKIEDMLNTVVRQIAFCEFERRVHDERKLGELPAERLKQIWMEIQKDSFGDAIELDESYGVFWTYISHFIHAPFYVYAYAFGDCLVNSLFAKYMENDIKDFDKKYLELLSAGGSKRYDELLQPFGLNPKDKSFWQSGLDKIAELIDSFEKC